MATAKTWLWIILGFLGLCVFGLAVLAGAGVYFVSHHIQVRPTTGAQALQAFDARRATFKTPPLIELDEFERPHTTRRLTEVPTSPVKPHDLHLLIWNTDDGRLLNISVPFWILRFGNQKMKFSDNGHGFSVDRLNLDIPELERIGPALVLDYRATSGERVLIWTQ